jgi:hypothetical protein
LRQAQACTRISRKINPTLSGAEFLNQEEKWQIQEKIKQSILLHKIKTFTS